MAQGAKGSSQTEVDMHGAVQARAETGNGWPGGEAVVVAHCEIHWEGQLVEHAA